MDLTSYIFVFLFLPLVLCLNYIFRSGWRNLTLTIMSYFFCAWANPLFVIVLFSLTVINYYFGLLIFYATKNKYRTEKNRSQKIILTGCIGSNLLFLGVFKYFNFGIDSYNQLINLFGLPEYQWTTFLRIALPLGISFYTFQAISYAIDVYRGDIIPTHRFIDFACYISMFPKLMAGPIIRYSEIKQQLIERHYSLDNFIRGVSFFALGFAKKIIISNPCGNIADICFNSSYLTVIDSWYGAFAYSFQIYFDFSAYSDMAIGLGLMLGFVFPKNFDSPYKSKSITEFWRRWHITLSSWLKDYLYIPLGGNRKGKNRTYANLTIVMLLGGLWHGASWNFVMWGGIHGIVLALERINGKYSFYHKLPKILRVFMTFIIVTIAWIFFRAETLQSSLDYLGYMFGLKAISNSALLVSGVVYHPYNTTIILIAAIITWASPQVWDFTIKLSLLKSVYISALFALSLFIMLSQSYHPFIYSSF